MGEGRGGGDLSFFLKVHVVCLAVLMDLPKIQTVVMGCDVVNIIKELAI